MVNIIGLTKASVLAALYNQSKPRGMGFLSATTGDMSDQEAQILLDELPGNGYFDYLKGRVMKVDISGDSFDERLYDHDLGDGAAREAISKLRNEVTSAS